MNPSPDSAGRPSDRSMEAVAACVEAFVRTRARVGAEDRRFSRQVNLWEDGYVDSIGVVELIGHIEASFGVDLPDEALFDPDFTSVEGIARIVSALPATHTG
jgi:acyl carrier protein